MRDVAADDPLPSVHPIFAASRANSNARALTAAEVASALPAEWDIPGFQFESSEAFVAAYLEGRVSPVAVAQRVLDATRASQAQTPAMNFFIAQDQDDVLSQARASAERYRAGKPLGPLDGVPVAVKDEVDQAGYPTTVGTRFLAKGPATRDGQAVARLRAAGAVLIGKANMHEIGIGVTGQNPHYGSARNPYDPSCATGGSSSGSAASVSAGLCPIAVGADGGGSIRIPASLCGVTGIKATFGRISEHGAAPLCWSVAHVGPIASTVRDLALAYGLMAGADEHDDNTQWQPAPRLDGMDSASLAGVRVGVFRPWFEHAETEVVAAARRALQVLQDRGATVVDIEIPELGLLRAVQLVTIVSEMAASQLAYHHSHRTEYGFDVRLNLALARALRGHDYAHAARLRAHGSTATSRRR